MNALLRHTVALARKFKGDKSGQIAVAFALTLVPATLGVGAAIDYSRGGQIRTGLQAAMDSAVLAAAIDGSSNWETAALNAFNANLASKGIAQATASFTLSNEIYSGTASTTSQTAFMNLIGIKSIAVNAKAAATTAKVSLCMLGLNAFDTGAFDMNGNSKLNAPDCAVHANTSSNKGMTQEGKPSATAASFGVAGAHTGEGYSRPPKDFAGKIADPFASIPFPAYTPCSEKNPKGLEINGGVTTLDPGTYCGGIRIKGAASVKLNPGIYVMLDGSFWVDGGSSVTGTEVVIAFTGNDATLRLWGNSTVNLTSPTSGTYKNFQFFQDWTDDKGRGAWVSIGGNGGNSDDASKATWDGIAYFPTQNFWVFGNPVVNANSPNMAIVAGQIWNQGNATINITNKNPRNLEVTKTMTTGGVRLLQ